MSDKLPNNEEVASMLTHIADLLEMQQANPHRVRAYRSGADRVRSLDKPVASMVDQEDGQALEALPDIGQGLARIITDFIQLGYSPLLERLKGQMSPEQLFSQVPGIGDTLAGRIARQLDIESLESLELAAYDGRLAQVEGFGPKRVRAVQVSLAGLLSRSAYRKSLERLRKETREIAPPPVSLLLELDTVYREKAAAGELPTIAPKRFNPSGDSWLPILHATRSGYHFTILYSNTARAHDLEKTHDWVVIYYEQNGAENQATVVTASRGSLEGKRVVRGRETECKRYYQTS